MAVTEFLEAVDKKKKAEQAAAAAAPVSAEVAPAAPAMQTPVATPQQLDQMLADPATVNVDVAAPAAPSLFGTPAPADPIAQPDVPAAAPAVQAPAVQAPPGQGTVLATPEAPTAAPEVKAPGIMDTITENFAGSKLGKFFGGMTTYDVSRGGDVVSGSGNPVFPSLAEKTETPAYGASDIPVPPAVEMATPESIADLSVNGTDVVTPEAITEAGQVAPAAVAPQTPTAGSGGMITRDSTGESFIGGSQVAATPEEVSAYNATSSERMAAANTDAAAAERMRYNAPTINAQAERAAAVQAERDQPRAPVRATEQERRREEARSEKTFRKEAAKDIRAKVREFERTNSMAKTREFERGLNEKLESDVIENRDYNRATSEANFANETAAYNRNTLTAAQRATDDGVSIRDQIALREEARGVEAKQLEETKSYNNASAAARSLIRDVGNIEGVAGTAKAQADSAFTTGLGGMVMALKPGSKASDLRASLDTLTADSAFSALSEMRASSKTGGALGAISERELTLLGAAKRSLSANQSDEQLIKNIDTYVKIRNRMMADAKLRFAQDYGVERANEAFGGGQGGASSAIPNDRNVSGDSATEANIAKYNV